MSDLKKDDRINSGESQKSRSSEDDDRILKDGTNLTVKERMAMVRSEWSQDVLPTPPKIPGWHCCWLSTTNSVDPIYKRMSRGYQPVRSEEIPNWKQYRVNEGEFEGCISCNEMLLFKIEEELYQEMMLYLHHELPMSEEEMLKNNLKPVGEDREGQELGQVEGFSTLARKVRTPTFSS